MPNVYGGNANVLVMKMQALLEMNKEALAEYTDVNDEEFQNVQKRNEARMREIIERLEWFRTAYMHGVHRTKRTPGYPRVRIEYGDWCYWRDQALAFIAAGQQHPLARLGQWGIDHDLTDEQAAERLLAMDPAELARIMRAAPDAGDSEAT